MRDQLLELAYDLWWTGEPDAALLWRDLDPDHWDEVHHNPVALLRDVDLSLAPTGWAERAADLLARWQAFHAEPRPEGGPSVAYLSMEFGLHESLPIYAGGLGMLAGDHLRSASDIGINLVGVGLLYRQGYFKQLIYDGRQVAAFPPNDPERLAMRPALDREGRPLEVYVPHGHHYYRARAWVVTIGRVKLVLLDTDFAGNATEHRCLTRQLYGGNAENRLAQEVLLGIGGARMLTAMGYAPDVFHLNEGHAAFVVLELWGRYLDKGMDPGEAWVLARSRCVFTTHTPVEAGHDRFGWESIRGALEGYRESLRLPPGAFMDRGRVRPGDIHETLCMTVLALRGSRAANGVSALHGEVSRQMWRELPFRIDHITNGVHPTAWLAPETATLLDEHLPGWRDHFEDADFWSAARDIPADALLACRDARRARLVAEVRRRLGRDVLSPDALTIGFARRFAPYKRANLLFTDPDRLAALLDDSVQLIFAGKAHPQDLHGQEILAEVIRWTSHPRFRRRIVFLPDYDHEVGRLLTQGCDVWLNTPRRPREASGTSGQKSSLNGNLNCSVLDGWWPEAWDGDNGWAIGDNREWERVEDQDRADADNLYSVLEQQVLPAFVDRAEWARRMAHTLATCVPVFNTHRMVRDYDQKMYRT